MDEKFLKVVSSILKTAPENLKENSTAESVPGWDSLTHWTVIGMLEDIYNVEFTMDEATEFKNLGDLYKSLLGKL